MTNWATTYCLPVLQDDRTFRGRYYDLFRDFWRPSFPDRQRELQDWNGQWDRVYKDVWDLLPALEAATPARSVQALDFADASQCFIREPDGKPKFQVQVNVRDFKPEDILVSTKGNQLLISAKSQMSKDDLTECKEFKRCFDLPPDVLPETLTTSLSRDGILSVAAQNVPEPVDEPVPRGQPQLQDAVIARDIVGSESTTTVGSRSIFAFELPVVGFFPEEIKVETQDRTLCISGTHEEKHRGLQSKYSFSKRYVLPPNVVKEQLRVCLRNGRVLVVEVSTAEKQPTVHMLPVEHK